MTTEAKDTRTSSEEVNKVEERDVETIKRKRKQRAKKANKLSQDQVRKNHVVSEKRRRESVRAIYDELVNMIPDLHANENRSEIVIYLKTMNHLKWLYARNTYLRKKLEKINLSEGEQVTKIPDHLIWELSPDLSTTNIE